MEEFQVVDTDNFGSDYPDESFVLARPLPDKEVCDDIARIMIDKYSGYRAPRYFKVVKMPYRLQPAFEP